MRTIPSSLTKIFSAGNGEIPVWSDTGLEDGDTDVLLNREAGFEQPVKETSKMQIIEKGWNDRKNLCGIRLMVAFQDGEYKNKGKSLINTK
jgi:hypothetical protein